MKYLKYSIVTVIFAITLIFLGAGFRGTSLTARNIVEKQHERVATNGQIEIYKMVSLDKQGNIISREAFRMVQTDDNGKWRVLLRLINPAEVKGVSLLSIQISPSETEQFLYMPALNTVQRISGSGKKGNFIDTDFAYEDLLYSTSKNFVYGRKFDENLNDDVCYVIEIIAQDNEAKKATNYSKRVLWITHEDFALKKIDHYDRQGKLMKTLTLTDFEEKSESLRLPTRFEMVHHLKKTSSMFVVTRGKYNLTLEDKYFTPEGLKNWNGEDDATILASLEP